MEKITLRRTGQAPLRCTAELLRRADGEHLAGRERNRWHEIEIYRLADGGCAVAIRYRTKWQGELGHDLAEVVECPSLVRGVLAEYAPLQHLAGFPCGAAYAERQARLEAEVRAGYEALVSEALDDDLFAVDATAAPGEEADKLIEFRCPRCSGPYFGYEPATGITCCHCGGWHGLIEQIGDRWCYFGISEQGYAATVHDLPGCISEGHTLEEARENIREAIRLHTEVR